MVQPCDYPKLVELLQESIRTGQPILREGQDLVGMCGNITFSGKAEEYSVRKPPPEPKWRPWTEAEIEAECMKGTVVASKNRMHIAALNKVSGECRIGGACNRRNLADNLLQDYVIAETDGPGAPCGVLETPTA